jgi:hypothetical protein
MQRRDLLCCVTLLAALVIAAAAFLFDGSTAVGQQPPGGGERGGRMAGMMGGGTMCAVGSNLFVLRGSTLYKINPDDLSIVKQVSLDEASGAVKLPTAPEGGETK